MAAAVPRTSDPEAIRRAMFEDGVVVVPDAVDEPLRRAALRAINTELGKGIPKEQAERFANGIQFPHLMVRPAIVDLYNKSRAGKAVQALLGATHPVSGGQIALRFPGAMCLDHSTYTPAPWWNQAWHIDGLTDEKEQFAKKGTVSNFSLLVGVVLADIPEPFMGNFVAFPGSHRQLESVFRDQPEVLQAVANDGEAGLPKRLRFRPAVQFHACQVTAKAGDVILAHYQLAHSIAPNTSSQIRYAIYFRLHAKTHPPGAYRPEAMRNIWLDYEGLKPLVEAARRNGTLHAPVSWNATDAITASMASMAMKPNHQKSASEWGRVVPMAPPEATALQKATEPLYDKEKWAEARAGMCRLSDAFPEDFMFSLKAAVCVALSDKDFQASRLSWAPPQQPVEYYVDNEAYVRRAIAVAPDIVACHCLLVRVLVGAHRYEEAVAAMEAAVELPEPSEAFRWTDGLVVDATNCATKALTLLNRDDDKAALVARVIAKYPKLEPHVAQAGWNRERMELWTEGRALMDKDPKDWPRGQRIFKRLAELEPRHFWVTLQAAACFTYGSGNAAALLKEGEAYARTTIDVDPTSIGGYGILARNLNLQGRHAEVIPLGSAVLNCRYEEIMKIFLLEMVRCLRAAYQKTNAAPAVFPQTLAALSRQFPQWAGEIDAVSREAACSVM